jgi:hypothetical protein
MVLATCAFTSCAFIAPISVRSASLKASLYRILILAVKEAALIFSGYIILFNR